MSNVPPVRNEPALTYAPGSPERTEIKRELERLRGEQPEVPLVIGGRERTTNEVRQQREPHLRERVCATWSAAGPAEAAQAIDAALAARHDWSAWSLADRSAILVRAADLLSGPWRQRVNAATMLGQGKTVREAEIDAAAELADFWRFNVYFAEQIAEQQPISTPGIHNRMEQRGLEGFVYAVTPFNFTAIGGNLPTAPALMGNTVVWKPSQTAILSNWLIFQILREAGLPDGVINFVPGDPGPITEVCFDHPEFAGVHFTGSSPIFRSLFREVGERIDRYRSYPRLVGETGGKDFVVMHASADAQAVATALVRGSFEYQGQKCSAASRAYIPDTLWPEVRERAVAMVKEIHQGDPTDLTTFMGAVIDGRAFARLSEAVALAKSSTSASIVCGGGCDDSVGWFVEPTIVETSDPHFDTMERELFGPFLTVYPYAESRYEETLELCDGSSPYALTGSVFADDRSAVALAHDKLRHAAGNFYVNDKPTGSVVGQQPFGGGRASGTNDKAGWSNNLMRWSSPRAVKETSVPPLSIGYPHMEPDSPRVTEPAEESTAPGVLVAVCRERADGERRVALTPDEVKRLGESGARVRLERGAGIAAGYPDESYALNGAELVADAAAALADADVVLRVGPPSDDEVAALPAGSLLISYLRPLDRPELSQALAARGLTALAVELVPRITRAQTMDALSSQANIAGYRGVLVASTLLPRYFPLLMTAAGTVPPAKVLVLGAGVAGLQAIATARRLGAIVSAFDVRPVVREQVESLGATFLEVELPETGETSGGYAQELSAETQRLQRELLAEHVAASDVVITTALVPGRAAPQLIGADMVASMRPGSVIVDLAAEAGGNCELTEPGATVVRENVTIVGDRNPAAAMPYDASRLYARNLTELLGVCLQEGRVTVDPEDAVIAGCLVCRDGAVVNPAVLERLK